MASCSGSFYRTFLVNAKLSPEAPGKIQMEEYLSWLAKQVERAILKGGFLVLAVKEGTNLHASHGTYIFLRTKAADHLYPPPLQETYL